MLLSGGIMLMSISSATMAKSASSYLSQGSQYLEWSMAEKNEQSSGVYWVRMDLPQFLLFPPPPLNTCGISIWAFTKHQFPCISPTKCTSNGKCKLLVVYSCYDRCHQLAQLHVIFKGLGFFFRPPASRWASFQPWKGRLCCLFWVRQVHQVRRSLR